jgi:glucose-6-phosphate-specific signal transduction histidine kinase
MGSAAMIYILSFINIGSCIQNLMGGGVWEFTDTQHGDLKNLLLFLQTFNLTGHFLSNAISKLQEITSLKI